MLVKFANILDTLIVYPENMRKNLEKMGGLVASEQVMLALIEKGLSRDDAYKVAQRNAAKAWDGAGFKESLAADETVKAHLTGADLDHVFDLRTHVAHVDHTFDALGL